MKKLAISIISSTFISYVEVFSFPKSYKISIALASILILDFEANFASTTDEFLSKKLPFLAAMSAASFLFN
jgi:hypothetical protein